MLLFSLQLVYGFIMAFAHMGYDGLHQYIPFNAARATHTNLLVVWLLCGFMGAAYYIIPEEADRELWMPKLAIVQWASLVLVSVAAVIGFHFNWWEGRKFLEIPRELDYLVVVNVLMFIVNIGVTIWKGKRYTTTASVLYMGLLLAALLYLPGMIDTKNQTMDSYWRWWVVHLWVEGVWELIMGGILSYLLIKLTGIDREVVEKWLYVIVGFTFLSGILGTGHHYYYIGTPRYWLMVGGIFGALEPIAFLGMAFYAIALAKKGGRNHPNKNALAWTIGCAVIAFVGAGVLGFAHTLPQVNMYTHGTLVTAMHGHLAFWGAYAMLILAFISYALAGHDRKKPVQSGDIIVRLLEFQHRHAVYDGCLCGRGYFTSLSRANSRHRLSCGAGRNRCSLRISRCGGDPVLHRHRHLCVDLHQIRTAKQIHRRRAAICLIPLISNQTRIRR